MLADRVRMSSAKDTGIFPPYLYLEGVEGVKWVDGYKVGSGVSKQLTADYMFMGHDYSGEGEDSYVTDTMIDLTDYNTITLSYQTYYVSGAIDYNFELDISSLQGMYYIRLHLVIEDAGKFFFVGELHLIASKEKDKNHTQYEARGRSGPNSNSERFILNIKIE